MANTHAKLSHTFCCSTFIQIPFVGFIVIIMGRLILIVGRICIKILQLTRYCTTLQTGILSTVNSDTWSPAYFFIKGQIYQTWQISTRGIFQNSTNGCVWHMTMCNLCITQMWHLIYISTNAVSAAQISVVANKQSWCS